MLEGSCLGSGAEVENDRNADRWAAETLKSLQSSSDGYLSEREQDSPRLSKVQCGSETLSIVKSGSTKFICRPPQGCSSTVNVWVPRRVTRDGFQHEVTPHIQVLNTGAKVKLMDAKELLGPLRDWTVTNFVTITEEGVSTNPEPQVRQSACDERRHNYPAKQAGMSMPNGASNEYHYNFNANSLEMNGACNIRPHTGTTKKLEVPMANGGPATTTSGNPNTSPPHLLCGQDSRLKGNLAPVFVPLKSFTAYPPPQYPPAYFPKVVPSAYHVMGSTGIPSGFQILSGTADALNGGGGEKTTR